jgi:uncharacterized protein YegL
MKDCNESDRKVLERLIEERQEKEMMDAVKALPVREKPSENGLAELLFVIDQSGSMHGEETEQAVVSNFNKVIAEQRKEAGSAVVSTVLFNSRMTTMHSSLPIDEVPEMMRWDYLPAGATALLDAVGTSIERICKRQAALPDAERPGATIVVIITDGEENSSRTYTQPIVKRMIQTLQEKHGWDFLYFGANVDHFAEAHNLGIDVEDSLSFDACEDGINLCMAECNHRVSYRRARKRLTGRV